MHSFVLVGSNKLRFHFARQDMLSCGAHVATFPSPIIVIFLYKLPIYLYYFHSELRR